MFDYQNIENHFENNNNKLHLLELQIAALDNEISQFLTELKVTPEKLSRFLENKDHFTAENWKTLRHERKVLEDKLQLNLKNIPNPRKTRKTYSERKVGSNWLFVK